MTRTKTAVCSTVGRPPISYNLHGPDKIRKSYKRNMEVPCRISVTEGVEQVSNYIQDGGRKTEAARRTRLDIVWRVSMGEGVRVVATKPHAGTFA